MAVNVKEVDLNAPQQDPSQAATTPSAESSIESIKKKRGRKSNAQKEAEAKGKETQVNTSLVEETTEAIETVEEAPVFDEKANEAIIMENMKRNMEFMGAAVQGVVLPPPPPPQAPPTSNTKVITGEKDAKDSNGKKTDRYARYEIPAPVFSEMMDLISKSPDTRLYDYFDSVYDVSWFKTNIKSVVAYPKAKRQIPVYQIPPPQVQRNPNAPAPISVAVPQDIKTRMEEYVAAIRKDMVDSNMYQINGCIASGEVHRHLDNCSKDFLYETIGIGDEMTVLRIRHFSGIQADSQPFKVV